MSSKSDSEKVESVGRAIYSYDNSRSIQACGDSQTFSRLGLYMGHSMILMVALPRTTPLLFS
jgi:hypothetical protein